MNEPQPVRDSLPLLARYLDSAGPDIQDAVSWIVGAGMGDTFTRYLSQADAGALDVFFADVAACDRDWVERHRRALRSGDAGVPSATALSPVQPGRLDGRDQEALREAGRAALAAGRWGTLVFAGGAATRFFSDAGDHPRVRAVQSLLGGTPPKGLFPLTPVQGRSFLDLFAAQTLEAGIASGVLPPLVLLSSSATDQPIRDWASRADLRGLPREVVLVIRQAEHPRLDADGNLIVRPDGRLVRTGDGHGGVFRALLASDAGGAALDRLRATGVQSLVLHNVDNAAARPFEAARLGWFDRAGCDFAMTVVIRTRPDEKVGLVARNDATDRIEVVEYSVCPPELSRASDIDGLPRFRLAHINTNLVRLDAVRADLPPTLYTGKRVPVGERMIPASSHEMLNQHLSGLLPRDRVGVVLMDRDACFLPTKSVIGEDSLETTLAAMTRRAAERLRHAGAHVAADAVIELDPCLGSDEEAPRGSARGWRIESGGTLCLGIRHGIEGPPWSDGLILEPGATLTVVADAPYGRIAFDAASRRVAEDPATAGRVTFGSGVRVRAGVSVRVRIAGDGILCVAAGHSFSDSQEHDIRAGEVRRIG